MIPTRLLLFSSVRRLAPALHGGMLASIVYGSLCMPVFSQTPTCAAISPQLANPASPGATPKFTVTGVANASSVWFIIQAENQPIASAPAYPGTMSNPGNSSQWEYTVNTSTLPLGGYKVTARLDGNGQSVYCQVPGFFTVAVSLPPSPSRTSCNWYGGTWTDYGNPNATWNLAQNSSGQITGTVSTTLPGCATTTWTVSGSIDPANPDSMFSLTASNPSPPGSGSCVAATTHSVNGQLLNAYCSDGSANFTETYPNGTKKPAIQDGRSPLPMSRIPKLRSSMRGADNGGMARTQHS